MLPVGIALVQSGVDEVKELEAKETRRKPGNSNVKKWKKFACCLFKVYDEFWMKCFDGMSFISSIFYNIIFVSLLNVLKIKVTYLSHCIQFSFISSFQLIE